MNLDQPPKPDRERTATAISDGPTSPRKSPSSTHRSGAVTAETVEPWYLQIARSKTTRAMQHRSILRLGRTYGVEPKMRTHLPGLRNLVKCPGAVRINATTQSHLER